MDRTVSISKGVFVFNTEKIHKSPKKHSKSQPTTNIFADNLWYKSYKTTWTDLQHKLEILHNNMFSNMLANLVLFVKKSYDNKVDEIPTAALLTGINMPDHEEQFKALAREIRMQVTPHVACLNSLSCQSVKHIVENVVDAFVNKVVSDEFFEEEDDERSKIKKINCNMPVLSAWYKDLYKRNKKRGKTRVNPLVVIITEVEGFDQKALQDFILISSSYLNELPIVLIFGIATSLSTLHKILPYQVSCKINIKVFSSQPSTVYLNSVLEHVFFAQNCYFRLGGKVFSLLTDIFLFYDLSVTGFIRNFKYALLEHFSSGNATALCTNPKYARQLLEDFKKEDFEAVRHLLSFRKFVENHPPEERIKLLTDDEFFKKKLVKELNNFHEYLYMFHVFLNVLNILVRDLPTAPLGKHVREIYALAARSPITATEEYKEALQLLKFQSRFELSAKVSKIANYLEEKLREPTKLEHNLQAYMAQLNVFVNNLQTVSDNVTEAQPKENEANFTDQMGRQKLKNKLLENMKSKPQNRYETLRSELLDFFSSSFEEYLRPPTTNYFHEIFVFDDISIQSHIIGSHRAAIHTALNDPHDYLQCSCCEIPNEAVILRSMPDICVAYKLHLECGKLINLYDWLQSFLSVVDPIGADEDDEKRVVKPELQARFTQAIAELEYLGFVKSSKRKADHVMRLTWGAVYRFVMSVDKRANLNMDRTLKNRIEANVREVLSSVSTFAVIPEMENLLVAIDDRLRSIEATCDGRLATLTRKIDYLDGKVSRIETMAGVEIDKIAENMSAKNFKDDIINTNVFKRIDVVYEGLLHRLAYLGAKVDNKFAKLQLTLDATQLRLTKLEQTLITRDSDIESELSFILSSTDDVKTTCLGMEQHILNEQQQLTNQSNSHTESVLKAQLADVNHELGIVNVTATQTLMHMEQVEKAQRELFEEANAYANKMADMFVQQWQQALRMETAVKRLDEAVAGARTESQNSLRALALQLGKVVAKEATGEGAVLGGCGEVKLSHLQETMEKNFEELFLKQDLLLEKLQMDESNMEAKISEMFERLIDTIEKKIIMTPRDIKNVEQLVKNLGNNARKNLQLIGNNVNYLLDKVDDCNAYIDGSVFGQLSKIQNMCNLTDSNTNLTIEPNVITNKNEAINTIMDKMTELEERNDHLMENLAKATKLAEKRDTIQMVTKLENLLQAYEKLETLFKNPKPTNNMKPLLLYKTESEIPDIPLISYQTKPELTATPTTTAEDELTDTTSTTSFTSDSRTV